MAKKSRSKPESRHGDNVVALAVKKRAPSRKADDARVQEALRLAQAFLAIEDSAARDALIALAERLVSYHWVRKVK